MQADTGKKKRMLIFFFFLAFVMAVYAPLITKSFASDDFAVLRRVVYARHGIFIKKFFRPLSDITLYSNYLVAGFNPVVYNLFNFISHACIAYMVFLVAGRIAWIPEKNRRFFSWLAALLFLTYPFHNESVAWGVGRASLMAALFGVLAMLVAVSAIRPRWKYFLVCLFFFIGLSGYESILVLPGIILLLVYDRRMPLRDYIPWIIWMGSTLIIHLVVRVLVSGVLWGSYGAGMIGVSEKTGMMKYLKVAGRILLPPMANPEILTVLCGALAIVLAAGVFLLWKKRDQGPQGLSVLGRFGAMFLLAMLIPLMFGISTRTYEGDRLFYFPSVILALALAWLISASLNRKPALVAGSVLIGYQFVFLQVNIHNWKEASRITRDITGTIKKMSNTGRHIYVVNIPEEYEGAHVLRNGFYDALWLEGVDTSRVTAINYIRTEQRREWRSLEPAKQAGGELFIPPFTDLSFVMDKRGGYQKKDGKYLLDINPATDCVLYWNGQQIKPLQ